MKNILILLFALFAVALKADDRTVPGRTLSVTPQNALIHLPEFRKRSYKVFIQDEKGIWQPIEVRNALVSSFSKHPQIWSIVLYADTLVIMKNMMTIHLSVILVVVQK